jgi:hypothetical protein
MPFWGRRNAALGGWKISAIAGCVVLGYECPKNGCGLIQEKIEVLEFCILHSKN